MIRDLRKQSPDIRQVESPHVKNYLKLFNEKLSNDFQISQALALMWGVIKSKLNPSEKLELILIFDKVFGLRLIEVREEETPMTVIKLAEDRKKSRFNNDFKKSDELRVKIQELGFKIEDKENNEYSIKKI